MLRRERLHRRSHPARPLGRDRDHRAREHAIRGADHPRPGSVLAREGVRRGFALPRGLEQPDHVPGHPPEPRRADHRLLDAVHPGEHPSRGGALVPRRRRTAADGVMGRDALRRGVQLRHCLVVHVLPRSGAAADRPRLQSRRRRSAGRPESQGHQVEMTQALPL